MNDHDDTTSTTTNNEPSTKVAVDSSFSAEAAKKGAQGRLEATEKEAPPPPACGVYEPGRNIFLLTRRRGKSLTCGGFGVALHKVSGESRDATRSSSTTSTAANTNTTMEEYLLIEEAIFLHERGILEILQADGTTHMEPQELYSYLNHSKYGLPLSVYLTYAHLRQQGFRVVRHDPARFRILKTMQQLTDQDDLNSDNDQIESLKQLKKDLRATAAQTLEVFSNTCREELDSSLIWDAYLPEVDFKRSAPGMPAFSVMVTPFANKCLSFSQITNAIYQGGDRIKLATVSDSGIVVLFGVVADGIPSIAKPTNDNGDDNDEIDNINSTMSNHLPISSTRDVQADTSNTIDNNESALMIFSLPLVQTLNAESRLPTTYVGVRRVRPSSKHVQQAFAIQTGAAEKRAALQAIKPQVRVYKVVDPETGQERRMTSKEKKQAKKLERREFEQQKAKLRQEQERQQEEEQKKDNSTNNTNDEKDDDDVDLVENSPEDSTSKNTSDSRFVQLKVNQSALQQELADLAGERNSVPPVLISSSQVVAAKQFWRATTSHRVVLDLEYAQEWAIALRQSMIPTVITRQGEDMRDMAYDIVPQVWERFRPESLGRIPGKNSSPYSSSSNRDMETEDANKTLAFELRARCEADINLNAICRMLQQCVYVSCGAKFGCDLLLYDGPRSERHAFAGLRVEQKRDGQNFPMPRAYDLAGYVRCLNTAGKLALLAIRTKETEGENGERIEHMAVLDLALERIRKDDRKRKRPVKTLEQRMKNLSKK